MSGINRSLSPGDTPAIRTGLDIYAKADKQLRELERLGIDSTKAAAAAENAAKAGSQNFQQASQQNVAKGSSVSVSNNQENRFNLDGSLKSENGKIGVDGKPKNAGDSVTALLKKNGEIEIIPAADSSKTGSAVSDSASNHAQHKKDGFSKDCPQCECETCRNRRYKDASDDSGVSFQNATKIDPKMVGAKVKSHEMEHVRREQIKAKAEGSKIISQSVRIKNAICPECGTSYVSGGVTRTVSRPDLSDFQKLFNVGAEPILPKEDSVS